MAEAVGMSSLMHQLKCVAKRFLLHQSFHPNWLGIFTNPFYIARYNLAKSIKLHAAHLSGHVLDVGCGQKPYQSFFNCTSYTGLEIDTPENRTSKQADYFYDGKQFPFSDGEFDSVLCNQVFEHVFEPENFLKEISRILKPGGSILLTVPFIWDEHEQPFDFARYTSFALHALFKQHGFCVLQLDKSAPDLSAIFQLINTYIYKKSFTQNGKWNLLLSVVLCAPFTLLGLLFGKLFPQNNDLYLDNIVLAKKNDE